MTSTLMLEIIGAPDIQPQMLPFDTYVKHMELQLICLEMFSSLIYPMLVLLIVYSFLAACSDAASIEIFLFRWYSLESWEEHGLRRFLPSPIKQQLCKMDRSGEECLNGCSGREFLLVCYYSWPWPSWIKLASGQQLCSILSTAPIIWQYYVASLYSSSPPSTPLIGIDVFLLVLMYWYWFICIGIGVMVLDRYIKYPNYELWQQVGLSKNRPLHYGSKMSQSRKLQKISSRCGVTWAVSMDSQLLYLDTNSSSKSVCCHIVLVGLQLQTSTGFRMVICKRRQQYQWHLSERRRQRLLDHRHRQSALVHWRPVSITASWLWRSMAGKTWTLEMWCFSCWQITPYSNRWVMMTMWITILGERDTQWNRKSTRLVSYQSATIWSVSRHRYYRRHSTCAARTS